MPAGSCSSTRSIPPSNGSAPSSIPSADPRSIETATLLYAWHSPATTSPTLPASASSATGSTPMPPRSDPPASPAPADPWPARRRSLPPSSMATPTTTALRKTAEFSSTSAPRSTRSPPQHGRCTLQLWDDTRNIVRTVVSAEAPRPRHPAPPHPASRRIPARKHLELSLRPPSRTSHPLHPRSPVRTRYLALLAARP